MPGKASLSWGVGPGWFDSAGGPQASGKEPETVAARVAIERQAQIDRAGATDATLSGANFN